MREQPQTISLAFRDASLERAYQEEASKNVQRTYRLCWTLTTFAFLNAGWLDAQTAGPENLRTAHLMRFAIGAPVLIAVSLVGWMSPATFARLRRAAASCGAAALFWFPSAMMLTAPNPARLIEPVGPVSTVVVILVVGAWCGILSTGLLVPVAGVLGNVLLIEVAGRRLPPPDVAVSLWYAWACFLAPLLAFIIEQSRRREFLATHALDAERARSERLLRNVLPATIADRLKESSASIAEHFDRATVLFGDIVGFTALSQELSPRELVAALDDVFSAFDDIAHRHGLEKIKTIGDAYMVVGGVPEAREDHAEAIALMALEMCDVLAARRFVGGRQLRMRIGIHTGPVVAGVIGKKKFIYDLWGDTVNTASRMESHGVEGAVQVTAATAELLRARFDLSPRGGVQVKGKGEMQTWLLERASGAKPSEKRTPE